MSCYDISVYLAYLCSLFLKFGSCSLRDNRHFIYYVTYILNIDAGIAVTSKNHTLMIFFFYYYYLKNVQSVFVNTISKNYDWCKHTTDNYIKQRMKHKMRGVIQQWNPLKLMI